MRDASGALRTVRRAPNDVIVAARSPPVWPPGRSRPPKTQRWVCLGGGDVITTNMAAQTDYYKCPNCEFWSEDINLVVNHVQASSSARTPSTAKSSSSGTAVWAMVLHTCSRGEWRRHRFHGNGEALFTFCWEARQKRLIASWERLCPS